MTMKMKIKMKYRSHRYDINRPRHRHKHKYTKYNIQSIMMVICIKQTPKQHLKSVHEKVKQHSGWVGEKRCL